MLKTVIVDDKPANSDMLHEIIRAYCPSLTVAGVAHTIDDAYSTLLKVQPQLLFLDIEMPPHTGFDLLRRFDPVPFEVIFITAYNQYAVQAFRENALDYLLKPIDIGLLQKVILKAEKLIGMKQTNHNLAQYLQSMQAPVSTKVSIPVLDGYLFVDYQDIVRCEASGSYSVYYMKNQEKLIVSRRLKECEESLPQGVFLRVHNSHIINLRYVNKYVRGRGGQIHMSDGSIIEVSASRKDAFLEGMKQRS